MTGEFETIGYYKGNIPVTVCIGDNQASFLGSVPSDDAVLINVGTGAQISYIVDRDTALEIAGDPASGAEIRPYDGKKYLAAGCSLCGGREHSPLLKNSAALPRTPRARRLTAFIRSSIKCLSKAIQI